MNWFYFLDLPVGDNAAYSTEGQITECLAIQHMGQLLLLIVIQNVQNFEYKITLWFDAVKITDYIEKYFK